MDEIDRSATNWNVVQLHVYLNPGEENKPHGQRAATMERTFDRGHYTFDEARDVLEGLLCARASTMELRADLAEAWRAQPDALEAALGSHSWAIFQHGSTVRDGIEVVMERMLRGLPPGVELKVAMGDA